MARNRVYACAYYKWKLFLRDGTVYADGRSNVPSLGKHSLGVKDFNTAERQLPSLDEAMAVKHGRIAPKASTSSHAPLNIERGWELFMEDRKRALSLGGVTEATQKRYRAVRDKHQQFCKKQAVQEWQQMTNKILGAYGEFLHEKGYSHRSLALELTTVKTVAKFLVSEQHLTLPAPLTLAIYRSPDSDTYCYRPEEVDAMVELCLRKVQTRWLGHLLTVLAHTGMRIGEATTLRWQDVDFDRGFLVITDNRFSQRAAKIGTVRTTKGARTRRVPLHSHCRNALQQLKVNTHPDGFVFHGPEGGRLSSDRVRIIFRREVIEPLRARFPTSEGDIGFKDGRIHSFRHYFVSECFAQGANDGEVRAWVGHRDSRVIDRYRHLRESQAAERLQRMQFVKADELQVRSA